MGTTRWLPSWNIPIFGAPCRPRMASLARRRNALVAPETTERPGNPWRRASVSSAEREAAEMPGSP
jgi:hypothetical protein